MEELWLCTGRLWLGEDIEEVDEVEEVELTEEDLEFFPLLVEASTPPVAPTPFMDDIILLHLN